MGEPIIKVENLSKKYVIGHNKNANGAFKYKTFSETVSSFGRGMYERLRHPLSPNREKVELEEFWALKDVSFDINSGDRVGIIGRNGAGKSTLLKLLCRITEPSSGRAVINGRVASLLEVGTGFHPELTGRENIYMNGAILGMKRAEIKSKFDEIVDFSGVEKFLDTPVKRYSSGMYVRLAFAVAAHLEPEILLVDEVLAVGDASFQKKCLGKMEDISKGQGRTILFVSHNMGAVKSLCNKGILLENGTLSYSNPDIDKVIEKYTHNLTATAVVPIKDRLDRKGNQSVRMIDFELNGLSKDGSLDQDQQIIFSIKYASTEPVRNPNLLLSIFTREDVRIIFLDSNIISDFPNQIPKEGNIRIALSDDFHLTSGQYYINVAFLSGSDMADYVQRACVFDVIDGAECNNGRQSADKGFCWVKQDWSVVS